MDPAKKKQLKDSYKSQLATGGVYCITCSGNQRRNIKSTTNIAGIKKRFAFAKAIKGCPDPAWVAEWGEFGADSFTLQVLEELTMKEGQSAKEFADDIQLLYEMWLEKEGYGASK